MFSAPATTRTPRANATTAGEPGPPDAAASHVTGASTEAIYGLMSSRGGGSRRWLISSQAYVTAATEEAAAAPDAHPGTAMPHANATMPASASSHAATAVTLAQIRVFTRKRFWRETYEIDACVIRDAATAAPKPLSMLTTVTPEAQLFSAASNAATPPKLAP